MGASGSKGRPKLLEIVKLASSNNNRKQLRAIALLEAYIDSDLDPENADQQTIGKLMVKFSSSRFLNVTSWASVLWDKLSKYVELCVSVLCVKGVLPAVLETCNSEDDGRVEIIFSMLSEVSSNASVCKLLANSESCRTEEVLASGYEGSLVVVHHYVRKIVKNLALHTESASLFENPALHGPFADSLVNYEENVEISMLMQGIRTVVNTLGTRSRPFVETVVSVVGIKEIVSLADMNMETNKVSVVIEIFLTIGVLCDPEIVKKSDFPGQDINDVMLFVDSQNVIAKGVANSSILDVLSKAVRATHGLREKEILNLRESASSILSKLCKDVDILLLVGDRCVQFVMEPLLQKVESHSKLLIKNIIEVLECVAQIFRFRKILIDRKLLDYALYAMKALVNDSISQHSIATILCSLAEESSVTKELLLQNGALEIASTIMNTKTDASLLAGLALARIGLDQKFTDAVIRKAGLNPFLQMLKSEEKSKLVHLQNVLVSLTSSEFQYPAIRIIAVTTSPNYYDGLSCAKTFVESKGVSIVKDNIVDKSDNTDGSTLYMESVHSIINCLCFGDESLEASVTNVIPAKFFIGLLNETRATLKVLGVRAVLSLSTSSPEIRNVLMESGISTLVGIGDDLDDSMSEYAVAVVLNLCQQQHHLDAMVKKGIVQWLVGMLDNDIPMTTLLAIESLATISEHEEYIDHLLEAGATESAMKFLDVDSVIHVSQVYRLMKNCCKEELNSKKVFAFASKLPFDFSALIVTHVEENEDDMALLDGCIGTMFGLSVEEKFLADMYECDAISVVSRVGQNVDSDVLHTAVLLLVRLAFQGSAVEFVQQGGLDGLASGCKAGIANSWSGLDMVSILGAICHVASHKEDTSNSSIRDAVVQSEVLREVVRMARTWNEDCSFHGIGEQILSVTAEIVARITNSPNNITTVLSAFGEQEFVAWIYSGKSTATFWKLHEILLKGIRYLMWHVKGAYEFLFRIIEDEISIGEKSIALFHVLEIVKQGLGLNIVSEKFNALSQCLQSQDKCVHHLALDIMAEIPTINISSPVPGSVLANFCTKVSGEICARKSVVTYCYHLALSDIVLCRSSMCTVETLSFLLGCIPIFIVERDSNLARMTAVSLRIAVQEEMSTMAVLSIHTFFEKLLAIFSLGSEETISNIAQICKCCSERSPLREMMLNAAEVVTQLYDELRRREPNSIISVHILDTLHVLSLDERGRNIIQGTTLEDCLLSIASLGGDDQTWRHISLRIIAHIVSEKELPQVVGLCISSAQSTNRQLRWESARCLCVVVERFSERIALNLRELRMLMHMCLDEDDGVSSFSNLAVGLLANSDSFASNISGILMLSGIAEALTSKYDALKKLGRMALLMADNTTFERLFELEDVSEYRNILRVVRHKEDVEKCLLDAFPVLCHNEHLRNRIVHTRLLRYLFIGLDSLHSETLAALCSGINQIVQQHNLRPYILQDCAAAPFHECIKRKILRHELLHFLVEFSEEDSKLQLQLLREFGCTLTEFLIDYCDEIFNDSFLLIQWLKIVCYLSHYHTSQKIFRGKEYMRGLASITHICSENRSIEFLTGILVNSTSVLENLNAFHDPANSFTFYTFLSKTTLTSNHEGIRLKGMILLELLSRERSFCRMIMHESEPRNLVQILHSAGENFSSSYQILALRTIGNLLCDSEVFMDILTSTEFVAFLYNSISEEPTRSASPYFSSAVWILSHISRFVPADLYIRGVAPSVLKWLPATDCSPSIAADIFDVLSNIAKLPEGRTHIRSLGAAALGSSSLQQILARALWLNQDDVFDAVRSISNFFCILSIGTVRKESNSDGWPAYNKEEFRSLLKTGILDILGTASELLISAYPVRMHLETDTLSQFEQHVLENDSLQRLWLRQRTILRKWWMRRLHARGIQLFFDEEAVQSICSPKSTTIQVETLKDYVRAADEAKDTHIEYQYTGETLDEEARRKKMERISAWRTKYERERIWRKGAKDTGKSDSNSVSHDATNSYELQKPESIIALHLFVHDGRWIGVSMVEKAWAADEEYFRNQYRGRSKTVHVNDVEEDFCIRIDMVPESNTDLGVINQISVRCHWEQCSEPFRSFWCEEAWQKPFGSICKFCTFVAGMQRHRLLLHDSRFVNLFVRVLRSISYLPTICDCVNALSSICVDTEICNLLVEKSCIPPLLYIARTSLLITLDPFCQGIRREICLRTLRDSLKVLTDLLAGENTREFVEEDDLFLLECCANDKDLLVKTFANMAIANYKMGSHYRSAQLRLRRKYFQGKYVTIINRRETDPCFRTVGHSAEERLELRVFDEQRLNENEVRMQRVKDLESRRDEEAVGRDLLGLARNLVHDRQGISNNMRKPKIEDESSVNHTVIQ